MDLVIRNGTVVTAGHLGLADIGVEDGKVVAIGTRLGNAEVEEDATGKLVVPGGVDPHVHLLDLTVAGTVADRPVDDFYWGTRSAAAGGVTTVCDFAYQQRGSSLAAAVDAAFAEASGHAWVDFSVHNWVSDPAAEVREEVRSQIEAGVPSFKFFMALDNFEARLPEYLEVMAEAGRCGGLTVLHCEDKALMDFCIGRVVADGRTSVDHYPSAKPVGVEVSATVRAMEMVGLTRAPAYIVHVSCAAALGVTSAARARGLPVYVETRPLYLHLTAERFSEPANMGVKYVGVPPLREAADVERLWTGLSSREIDTVATDHVGWSLAQKLATPTIPDIASGVQALETSLALLYSEGVRKGRISLSRWVELTSTTPAKILGMFPRKGTIAVGCDADLVVFDPTRTVVVRSEDMHGATDFDPYEGFEVHGWPIMTFLRGRRVYDRGELIGEPGGVPVPRAPFEVI